ncbi:hypothetical protein R1sor_024408 [Riccia sorocarpa]|uniref:Uncharacterized protein n=1 Tax=Riccia sorocarpa TaxID=122646 RepID=A0ABD3GQF0_9MARC
MHRLQSLLDEIENLDGKGPRKSSHLPLSPMPMEFTSVEAIVASMEMELDDLDPRDTSSPERKLVRKYLDQLIKVATLKERMTRDLHDELKEKTDLISILQETVNSMREKKPVRPKACPYRGGSSPRRAPLSAASKVSDECSRCCAHVEAQLCQTLADTVFQSTREKSTAIIKPHATHTPEEIQPDLSDWPSILTRATIEKLEENVKLSKEVEILKRKLEEYKHVLASSEYQRSTAQASAKQLMDDVRKYKQRLAVLEESEKQVSSSSRKKPKPKSLLHRRVARK